MSHGLPAFFAIHYGLPEISCSEAVRAASTVHRWWKSHVTGQVWVTSRMSHSMIGFNRFIMDFRFHLRQTGVSFLRATFKKGGLSRQIISLDGRMPLHASQISSFRVRHGRRSSFLRATFASHANHSSDGSSVSTVNSPLEPGPVLRQSAKTSTSNLFLVASQRFFGVSVLRPDRRSLPSRDGSFSADQRDGEFVGQRKVRECSDVRQNRPRGMMGM
jgi:hypothetical protein